ncbi:MAG: acyl-CoA thioesterase [Deltaproteobacteria bacterium]|nr:acyl-CoA thioesterase [Deltaproteobacteria bacterium]
MRPKPFIPVPFEDNIPYVRDKTDNRVWYRCHSRVLYADTDRSGLVYHSNYFRFFELGRASLMRDAAYSYREIEAGGYLYPIIEVGVNYHSSLHYDDPVWIHTHPAGLERVRLRFDYVITHGETGEIVCKGFTRHCALNATGTPVAIDEKTRHLWKVFPR